MSKFGVIKFLNGLHINFVSKFMKISRGQDFLLIWQGMTHACYQTSESDALKLEL